MYVNSHVWRGAADDDRLQSHLPPQEHRTCVRHTNTNLTWIQTQVQDVGCTPEHLCCSQVRRCCGGFFGEHCEPCPGPKGQPCFGNGLCLDGITGSGVCQCNKGFNGTACETCHGGKYGVHCDQGGFASYMLQQIQTSMFLMRACLLCRVWL